MIARNLRPHRHMTVQTRSKMASHPGGNDVGMVGQPSSVVPRRRTAARRLCSGAGPTRIDVDAHRGMPLRVSAGAEQT